MTFKTAFCNSWSISKFLHFFSLKRTEQFIKQKRLTLCRSCTTNIFLVFSSNTAPVGGKNKRYLRNIHFIHLGLLPYCDLWPGTHPKGLVLYHLIHESVNSPARNWLLRYQVLLTNDGSSGCRLVGLPSAKFL